MQFAWIKTLTKAKLTWLEVWGLSVILGGCALAAEAPSATLATDDTSVQVAVRREQIVLVAFKSTRTGWNWTRASEMPLISSLEVNGQPTPIAWKFKTCIGSKGPPVQEIFIFENENP